MFNVIAVIIKLVEYMSLSYGARLTMFLASWPRRLPLNERDKQALAKATRLEIKTDKNLVAWSWGTGPIVLLVHGWEGNSAQMASIALHLAENGFQAVSVDVRAHGASKGKRTQFFDFSQDMASVIKHLNKPVYACIGHSAGGLLLMAGRANNIIQADNYITIASPCGPYPPLEIVQKLLKVSNNIVNYCQSAIAKQFSCQWNDLIQGKMFEYQNQGKLMLIYDKSDKVIKHTDAEKILNYWPDAHLFKTDCFSHFKLLHSPEIITQISNFLLSCKNESHA